MFNPEIWGTVSDWCMVIVTMVTAYYLYKTLQSQKQVQQTQNELFRIESILFQESIKPVMKYEATTEMFKSDNTGHKVLTVKVVNTTASAALNISRVLKEGTLSHQIFIPMGLDDRRDHLVSGDAPLLFHFLIEPNSHKMVGFALNYDDVSGRKYKQAVICFADEMGIEIHAFLPETG